MNTRYANRHVVVTGGAGALGAAIVSRIVAEGGHCYVPVHTAKETPRVAGPGTVLYVEHADLADETAVERFYREVASKGGLWASIHTAGGFAMSAIAETRKADFDRMMAMNCLTTFLCCREAVRAIRLTGGGGRIVNVAAKGAVAPSKGMLSYVTSKAAVVGMTQALAEEVAPENILVNAVLPSIMDTPANRKAMPGADFAAWPRVEEVADTILFLASPDNTVTRSALVPVYGRS